MLFSDESISEWRYPAKSLDNGVSRQLASRQDRNRVTMHFPITAVKTGLSYNELGRIPDPRAGQPQIAVWAAILVNIAARVQNTLVS
jgi:hypothetical protein